MSAEAVRRFWNDVDKDTALREAVDALFTADNPPQASAESIVTIAALHGYDFTVDELRQHAAASNAELSEAELEAVSGGTGARAPLSVKGGMVMIN